MKRSLIILFVACIVTCANAQDVVRWSFAAKKKADNSYELYLKATIQEPWHIYSQSTPVGGPLPTKISFSKNPLVSLSGKTKEVGKMEMYHEDIFNVDVYAYSDTVDFVQLVKLKTNVKTTVSGEIEFMACTKEQCLTPKKIKFTLKLE